ncbi:MAG: hypothetical protein WC006_02795 [Bacilli bacterium]|nr:hypothetical protein [Bacilli bacterium]
MKIKDYFNNDFETLEDHYIPELRTRYYRCSNDTAKKAVMELIESENAKVKDIIDQYNEIFFQAPNYTCTITVISPRIAETAIDIKITTYKIIAAGAGKKIIERMYKYLDSKLPFKGVSLYKG